MELPKTPQRLKRPRYFGHTPTTPDSASKEKSTPKKPRYFGHSPYNSPKRITFDNYRKEADKTDFQCLLDEDKIVKLVLRYGLNTLVEMKSVLSFVPKSFPNRFSYCTSICGCMETLKNIPSSALSDLLMTVDELPVISSPVTDFLWRASKELDVPVTNFLVPKVEQCLLDGCNGKLYGRKEEVIEVTVYTMSGPVPSLKASLSCCRCGARYGIDKYRHRGGEARFYPDHLQNEVVEATHKVYFSRDTYEFMCESGNHGFVSAQAFSHIYQSVFHAEHYSTKRFLSFVTADNKHYTSSHDQAASNNQANSSQKLYDSDTEGGTKLRLNPFMSRKNANEAFFNGELEKEVRERRLEESLFFKDSASNIVEMLGLCLIPGIKKNDKSREEIMRKIDDMRRTELYPHPAEDCNDICQQRGCQNLRVIDSCWKLGIPHCMLAVQTEVEGSTLLSFPNVCTEEPMSGSVFCGNHHEILVRNQVPTEKSQFLKFIGCHENPQSPAEIRQVDEQVLNFMSKLEDKDEHVKSTVSNQEQLPCLIKCLLVSSTVIQSQKPNAIKILEKKHVCASEHVAKIAVTGGGNILCFNPIYKSESPSQVFMLAVQMIYSEVKHLSDDEVEQRLQEYILSYDNMCNLDKLKAASQDLPLPGKFARMWKIIRKIIDRLHLKNHKEKKCQEQYNPEIVLKDSEKCFNTMAAEQLFSWMSRFKKVVNSMTQIHHLFYLHRMCKRRNRYSALCRRRGVEPVHPGVNSKL